MLIEIGVLLALGGCLAALAGAASMRRSERLRTHGVAVWAMTLPQPEPASERERERRTVLQYTLDDGTVVERTGPSQARTRASLEPGRKVLIWYDPDDPAEVLVFGHYGRRSDRAFVIGGLLLVLAGVLVAIIA